MCYGVALCASLLSLVVKSSLLIYKLRKRSGLTALLSWLPGLMRTSLDVDERLDIHKQQLTKALLHLLVACCEVRTLLRLTDTMSRPLPMPALTLSCE